MLLKFDQAILLVLFFELNKKNFRVLLIFLTF